MEKGLAASYVNVWSGFNRLWGKLWSGLNRAGVHALIARPPNCCKHALPRHLRPGSALCVFSKLLLFFKLFPSLDVSLFFDTHHTPLAWVVAGAAFLSTTFNCNSKTTNRVIITGTYGNYSRLRLLNHYELKQTHKTHKMEPQHGFPLPAALCVQEILWELNVGIWKATLVKKDNRT